MRVPSNKAGNVAKMYDFGCECGHTFEAMAKYGEDVICPKCAKIAAKLISAPRVDSHAAANWRR